MTQQQFEELKSLIQVNFEMIGRVYEEHGTRLGGLEGRLTRVEVGQEQLRDDLRGVAEGVAGNTERLERLGGRFDGLEAGFTHHDQRLRALEN
jgi:hypothetical protein